jgi:hypothetical protein
MYQRECGLHYLETIPPESNTPILDMVLHDYIGEHCIGPLVRFSHGHSRGPASLEWKGSILLAVEQGCGHLSMTFQRSVRAISLKSKSQGCNSLPERPAKVQGSRFLDCYGYHFWRFDLSISLHPTQETDCKYYFTIVRHNVTSHISGHFLLGSMKACDWRVKYILAENSLGETLRKMSNLQDNREYHIAVIPDWSPFFLENKTRAEAYGRAFASTPYICERHHTPSQLPAAKSDEALLSNGNSTRLWQTVFSLHKRPPEAVDPESRLTYSSHNLRWSSAIWLRLQALRSERGTLIAQSERN